MPLDAIVTTLPDAATFVDAPHHEKQRIVVALVGTILDQFAREDREPDRWEAEYL